MGPGVTSATASTDTTYKPWAPPTNTTNVGPSIFLRNQSKSFVNPVSWPNVTSILLRCTYGAVTAPSDFTLPLEDTVMHQGLITCAAVSLQPRICRKIILYYLELRFSVTSSGIYISVWQARATVD